MLQDAHGDLLSSNGDCDCPVGTLAELLESMAGLVNSRWKLGVLEVRIESREVSIGFTKTFPFPTCRKLTRVHDRPIATRTSRYLPVG